MDALICQHSRSIRDIGLMANLKLLVNRASGGLRWLMCFERHKANFHALLQCGRNPSEHGK
jgi:hypothetical protein